jgi:hypothetical protein
MHCLRCLVVTGAVAVAVSVIAAGPAAAAKGGNNDNAHACQQGGHAGMFDESELPFKNAGGCASHGAIGRPYIGLWVMMTSYPCSSDSSVTCYGTVNGGELVPNAPVGVVLTFSDGEQKQEAPLADGNGNLDYKLEIICDADEDPRFVTSVYASGTINVQNHVASRTPIVSTPC